MWDSKVIINTALELILKWNKQLFIVMTEIILFNEKKKKKTKR